MSALNLGGEGADSQDMALAGPSSAAATPRSEVALVRQPIADARHGVVGYEVRFGAARDSGDPSSDARATSALIADAFGDIGLERLAGNHLAWLSIARNFLIEVGPPPVRPDRAVLQIAAYPAREDLLSLLRKLSMSGYSLALTDYEGGANLGPLLELCPIVKVDVGGRDEADLARVIEAPARAGSLLVARGVADAEDFERCRALGFSYFQGDYFCRPREMRFGSVSGGSVGSLETLAQLCSSEVGFEELERIVTADVGLSLKLLRYVNSAFLALPRTVGSIREAIGILGTRMVRRWALVVALADNPGTPGGLVALALHRARMCECLADPRAVADRDALYTIGLFSVADALLGAPMEDVLAPLPFSMEIEAALLHHAGPKGEILASVLEYERGDFAGAVAGEAVTPVARVYQEALEYADEAARAVRGE